MYVYVYITMCVYKKPYIYKKSISIFVNNIYISIYLSIYLNIYIYLYIYIYNIYIYIYITMCVYKKSYIYKK